MNVRANRDQRQSMSDVAFVQKTLREVYTIERFGSVKAAQIEAFDFLQKHLSKPIPLRRVRAMFEGTLSIIKGEEKDAVRAAKIEEARNEYKHLRDRLKSLETTFAVVDPEFFGPQMDAYREVSNGLGGSHRSGAE